MQIASNAGHDDDAAVIVDRVAQGKATEGFDARTDQFVDMMAAGIIDPVKVTRSAVEHAASAAAILLTTEAAVAEAPEKKSNKGGNSHEEDDFDY